jgi:hypothetical protein
VGIGFRQQNKAIGSSKIARSRIQRRNAAFSFHELPHHTVGGLIAKPAVLRRWSGVNSETPFANAGLSQKVLRLKEGAPQDRGTMSVSIRNTSLSMR